MGTRRAAPVVSEHRVVRTTVRAAGRDGAVAIALSAADPVVRLAMPVALTTAVDATVRGEPTAAAILWLGALLAAVTLVEAGKETWTARLEARGAHRLRSLLFGHVVDVGLPIREQFATGDLVSRSLAAVEGTSRATPVLLGLGSSAVTAAGGLAALFAMDLRLGLVFVLAAPVVWWLTSWLVGRVGALTTDYQRISASIAARLVDALEGARTIRASGTLEQEVRRVLRPLAQLHGAGTAYWQVQRTMAWRVGLLVPALQIGVLATAGWGVTRGDLTVGELLAAQVYLGYSLGLLKQVALLSRLAQVRACAGRIEDVLAVPAPPPGSRALPPGPGSLSLRGVWLRRSGRTVLRGVDLQVPAGQTMALVGRSGSGKSMLAWTAAGLIAPDAGTVLLDQVPLEDLVVGEVQRGITCAFERPTLLGETIEDALRYADQPIPIGSVGPALAASAATDFVARLPDGARTRIADLRVSGGELQRLGLARAACRSARVVVLDDATSSMDTVTEATVLDALVGSTSGRTRLLVAHRRTTAARADLVAWVQDGCVRAVDRHDTLMREPDYRAVFDVDAPARTQDRADPARDRSTA